MSENTNISWPPEFAPPLPQQIMRPCDADLARAVKNLEIQLGTIEAYNRLAKAAHALWERIADGNAKKPEPGTAEGGISSGWDAAEV